MSMTIEGAEIFIVHVLDVDGEELLGAATTVDGAKAICQRQADEWAEQNDLDQETVRWNEPDVTVNMTETVTTVTSKDVLNVQFEITSTLLEG